MLDNGADGWFPDSPCVVGCEDAFEGDCLCNGTTSCQRSDAHEAAQGYLSPLVYLKAMQDENRYAGTDKIRERVQAKSNISGEISDVR